MSKQPTKALTKDLTRTSSELEEIKNEIRSLRRDMSLRADVEALRALLKDGELWRREKS